jgi:hypothetical protein
VRQDDNKTLDKPGPARVFLRDRPKESLKENMLMENKNGSEPNHVFAFPCPALLSRAKQEGYLGHPAQPSLLKRAATAVS